jgi:hypothetical protein
MNGGNFYVSAVLTIVWLVLVFLMWAICRWISPNVLGKRDPEAIFVYVVLVGAIVYAISTRI